MNKQAQLFDESTSNQYYILLVFIIVMLFQMTALKFIWSAELVSRVTNAVLLTWFSYYALRSLLVEKFCKSLNRFYIIPGVLVYMGVFINLSVSTVANVSVFNQFGLLLPWAIFLSAPKLMKANAFNSAKLWKWYYLFMCTGMVLSTVEYFLLMSDVIEFRYISTSGGFFFAGLFNILIGLDDGTYYDRFHAFFMEPGTLAMFLLPAMSYAIFNKKYFGLLVFSFTFYLTKSLGGYFSLALFVLIILMTYLRPKVSKVVWVATFCLLTITALILFNNYGSYYTESYEQRIESGSAVEREDNLQKFLLTLPNLVINYPIGLPIAESTEIAERNSNYFGSTFAPGNAMARGGIAALLGYISILLTTLVVGLKLIYNVDTFKNEKMVAVSLIALFPYVYQRESLWDGALFSFLFAPTIIRYFLKSNSSALQNPCNPHKH